jgi:hypothetical protein
VSPSRPTAKQVDAFAHATAESVAWLASFGVGLTVQAPGAAAAALAPTAGTIPATNALSAIATIPTRRPTMTPPC